MIYIVFVLFFALLLYVGNAALSIFIGILFTLLLKPEKSFISMKVGTIPLQIGIVILGATISLLMRGVSALVISHGYHSLL